MQPLSESYVKNQIDAFIIESKMSSAMMFKFIELSIADIPKLTGEQRRCTVYMMDSMAQMYFEYRDRLDNLLTCWKEVCEANPLPEEETTDE